MSTVDNMFFHTFKNKKGMFKMHLKPFQAILDNYPTSAVRHESTLQSRCKTSSL